MPVVKLLLRMARSGGKSFVDSVFERFGFVEYLGKICRDVYLLNLIPPGAPDV